MNVASSSCLGSTSLRHGGVACHALNKLGGEVCAGTKLLERPNDVLEFRALGPRLVRVD
ncbi:hypothetical protein GGTG_05952 [Gaeumannomyces tritici R3-111a-1]|uniref:Uncharacterized protein n=1 Tax=Gaeumannomyces tritici (strain R3-111a-1) TaxID=644352 RepID=J3NXE6_GAET3|nr:hypothetical protein GGTG_05952 [Gaeumannomyces tritici R3-111a-1]EJT76028.1 hypothetical protein GGTG_05952 [Gaeumannomyces tritici R3-111a-1]